MIMRDKRRAAGMNIERSKIEFVNESLGNGNVARRMTSISKRLNLNNGLGTQRPAHKN